MSNESKETTSMSHGSWRADGSLMHTNSTGAPGWGNPKGSIVACADSNRPAKESSWALELKAPVQVQVELTEGCNQNCLHCYNYWRPLSTYKPETKYLSVEDIRRIVGELRSNEVISVTVTGGEPFVRTRELFALLEEAQVAGIATSINTNLSLPTTDDIDRLASEYPNISLLVSLLSSDPDLHERLTTTRKGTYAKVIRNVNRAVSRGLRVNVNMVVMHENLKEIRKVAELALDLGAKTFCATKVVPPVHARAADFFLSHDEVLWFLSELINIENDLGIHVDSLQTYPMCMLVGTEAFSRFSDHACAAGISTLTIGADGAARPCSQVPVAYGNILREGLPSIWRRMCGWREGEFLPEKCRDCKILGSCTAGCRMNSILPGLQAMDYYAEPETILTADREHLLARGRRERNLNNLPDRVGVSHGLKIRAEAFGAVVYLLEPWGLILINKPASAFLTAMDNKPFTFKEFVKASGVSNDGDDADVSRLFYRLFEKQMLVPM